MSNIKGFFNQDDLEFTDISMEKVRTYHYPNGVEQVIKGPVKLNVSPSSLGGHAHRLISLYEDTIEFHYVAPGWLRISWTLK